LGELSPAGKIKAEHLDDDHFYLEYPFPLHHGEDHAEIRQFLDHLAEDAMPALIERLSTKDVAIRA
jgi:hypothetical protein